MYSFTQVKRGFGHPRLLLRELNRLYFTRLDMRPYNTDGVAIVDEDWDNLYLLDACRYDMFEAESSLPGDLSSRTSRGSNTVEFLRGNFEGRQLHDTVYVTANPQFRRHEEKFETEFFDVIDIWKDDGWDETYGTVLPETTARYATEAAEKYPDKRLLVHFMQPHYPFLDLDSTFDKGHLHNEGEETDDFWHEIFYGRLDIDPVDVWDLYMQTLRKTLPHVEGLLRRIEGRSIVTSDHGNMVGERASPVPIREWGHPQGIHVPTLVRVPWLVYESGTRRDTVSETPVSDRDVDPQTIENRLQALGYRQ